MSDIIAAIATGRAPCAIGILRLSGPGCAALTGRVFTPKQPFADAPDRRLVLGLLHDRQGRVIDECLGVVCRAPHSYTGEETVELQCHGSPAMLAAGLEALLAAGARVSAVTMAVLPEDSIQWGVLTFLGSAALLFHWLRPWLERCPPQWGLLTCVVLFGLTRQLEDGLVAEYSVIPAALYQTGQLGNFLGFPAAEFASADYFPLLPWVFLYGAGWFVHAVWRSGEECELPKRGQLPALAWMGRHSLAIYLLHQPALYGALLAAESWMK